VDPGSSHLARPVVGGVGTGYYTRRVRTHSVRPALVLQIVLVAVALLVAFALLARPWIELDPDVLPGTDDAVDRATVLDRFTFYVSKSRIVGLDVLNGMILVSISAIAFLVVLGLIRARAAERLQWFFLTASVGAGYVALDELAAVHESLGHNLRFLGDIPGVDHPDDVILALYIVPAVAFLVSFRDVLRSSRLPLALFAGSIGLFVLSVLFDLAKIEVEDAVEVLGALVGLAGFIALTVENVVFTVRVAEP